MMADFHADLRGALNHKFDGKSRRTHEQTHNPPPVLPDIPHLTSATPPKPKEPIKSPGGDDLYNYNCALLQDGFLFLSYKAIQVYYALLQG